MDTLRTVTVPMPPNPETAHSEGGTSIEDLAEKYPEKIVKVPVDIRKGLTGGRRWGTQGPGPLLRLGLG
jgi:hypothetical protein